MYCESFVDPCTQTEVSSLDFLVVLAVIDRVHRCMEKGQAS